VPLSEDPVKIQLNDGSNQWRLPKRLDLGGYVIRKIPGKIRRVWVQPCWVGKCSPRKFLNEQEKRDVLRFMKYAIKVRTSENTDLVREFIEKPYFFEASTRPVR
jgi:hypothetical protein